MNKKFIGNVDEIMMKLQLNGEKVTSVCEILKKVDEFCRKESTGSIWLRGHGDSSWELIPTIGREHYYIGRPILFKPHQEKNLLHRFRRYAYAHLNRNIEEWEALLLGRHYGLPVRLLEWTSNPLIALYFAASYGKEIKTDGAIWVFLRKPDDSSDIDIFEEKRSPFQIKGVRIIYPFISSPRISAQSSAFTIQDNPWQKLANYEGKKCPMDIKKLAKWIIPKDKKEGIIEELERTSINYRVIYPDLGGLAKGLWQAEIIRKQR